MDNYVSIKQPENASNFNGHGTGCHLFLSASEFFKSKLVWSLAKVWWQSRVRCQFPHLVLWSSNLISWAARLHRLVTKATFFCYFFPGYIYIYWLVVWTIFSIFPYIGNNSPNWLICFQISVDSKLLNPPDIPRFFDPKMTFSKWLTPMCPMLKTMVYSCLFCHWYGIIVYLCYYSCLVFFCHPPYELGIIVPMIEIPWGLPKFLCLLWAFWVLRQGAFFCFLFVCQKKQSEWEFNGIW
jgi:hypothetical protein